MVWIPIKQYIQEHSISDSTIRRKIRSHKVRSKRLGTKWLIWSDRGTEVHSVRGLSEGKGAQKIPRRVFRDTIKGCSDDSNTKIDDEREGIDGAYSLDRKQFSIPNSISDKDNSRALSEIIAFSSKALNSYLMVNDKLVTEKEKRIQEKEFLIKMLNQKVAELESYVSTLEKEERRLRELQDKPEGWR